MRHHTSDMEEIIRNAERESEKVCRDKSAIMQRWTASVINIAKRDEALVGFREAMKAQQLELKGIKAVIEGTKSEIISYQVILPKGMHSLFKRISMKSHVKL